MPLTRRSALTCLGLSSLPLPLWAQTAGDVRVALVIGNSAYADDPLPNPANDARAMAATLRGLGFTVVEVRDGDRVQMVQSLGIARDLLQGKRGVGMLYYAGHGLQLNWHNYMVPVDARLGVAADVPEQTVDVDAVIEAFRGAGNRMNILVLDACRDNPFGTLASGKGLAPLDAPTGTLLAYATAPGNVALDGAVGGNGLYTQFLLQEIRQPSARIEDVFKRVRLQVRQKSLGRQIPWESTSLEDDFYFNTGRLVAQPKLEERLKAAEDPAPKAAWEAIQNSREVNDFYAFLLRFPSSGFSELAQASIQRLQKAQLVTVADRNGFKQVEGGARFRMGDTIEWDVLNPFRGDVKVSTLSATVTQISADLVRTSLGTVYTPEGWPVVGRNGNVFSPVRQTFPAGEFTVGKSWSHLSGNSSPGGPSTVVTGVSTIVAFETLSVPAGNFKCYKVESFLANRYWRRLVTEWLDPEWGLPLKTVDKLLSSTMGSGGTPLLQDTLVMRSRQRGAG